ncbi:MAG TPA: tripartite tricarboxylate transporter substrate-binding protein, partial [Ramlibacter sp.]|nr:tripartite tricarboxylate transporter substrate-binding protein [Ramlibacter sp.]
IGQIAASPFAIVVNKDLKVANLRELIELARSKPRSINYGSAGAGGTNHLGTEFFASSANVQLTHVAYKGIASAFTDLMSGTLQMLVPSMASAATHIHSGKLRVLAVTGAQRSALAPEIPTASEAGVPGFRLEVWFGLLGPARMPAHVVTRLNQELNAVLAQAEVRDLLKREGARAQPGTAEEFANLVRADLARWTQLVKERNIQVE